MKAALRRAYGGAESISIEEVETPTPQAYEVLVKIRAATVNRTDCAILTGKPFIMRFFTGLTKPRSPITGTDFAGEIVATGAKATRFQKGDRVFGFNDLGLKSHAEYLSISENAAIEKIPDPVDFDLAAASLEAAHYAYNFLTKVKLEHGQRALVNGASGGIGSALVQFLKHFGVHVTAVCSTKNLALVQSLGAALTIDYLNEDFTAINEKFDYVFDAVGKSTFAKCKPLLNEKGIYISSELGPKAQNPILALVTPLGGGKKVRFPVPVDTKRSIKFISGLLVSGKFAPVIDRSYPLQQISDAYAYVMTGEKTGNVVLTL